MDPVVAAAVLAASLLHASWHALVKSSGDGVIALAGMNLVSAAAAFVLLPFVPLPTPVAAVVIAISVVLHAGYKIALADLYSRAQLSQGYPLARGLIPVFATLIGFAFLGETPGTAALAGVGIISLGVVGLLLERGTPAVSPPALLAAMVVAATVAAYSALDAYGIRVNGDWLGFLAWLVICDSAAFVAYAVFTRRGKALAHWRLAWRRTLLSGMLGITSFGIFLWALSRANIGPVTALRETSTIFAAILAATVLKEPITRARCVSAALVAAGAAAIVA
jgi:drug/metabolite transporter (DMT)-like permease